MNQDMKSDPSDERSVQALNEAELDAYLQHGFVIRQGLFNEAECDDMRAAADAAELKALARIHSDADTGSINEYWLDGNRFVDIDHITVQFEHYEDAQKLRVIEPINDVSAELNALIDDPRLTGPMRQLVGCGDLSLWTAKLNFKYPKLGSGFGWHQDAPYWMHDCGHVHRLPNVMVLFDDAAEENGCLRFIPGSHTHGCLPGCEDDRQLAGFYTNPSAVDLSIKVPVVAQAGSVAFFDPFIVHGSGANHSERPRRAMIVTYQPEGHPALKSGLVRPVG
jgi:phytanoyl-CoA hydroxylase